MELFDNLTSYQSYIKDHPFHHVLGIKLEEYGDLEKKIERDTYYSADPDLQEPYTTELDDLIRLHYLVTSRKVTTILEFGVGKSSIVFDHALKQNEKKFSDFVSKKLRRSDAFKCFSVDNNKEWLERCKQTSETTVVKFHYSECIVSSFNGRICTFFRELPNVCPDLIYIDGPDQFTPVGDVRGISTRHPDRLAMSADVLAIEHFLLPGTLIVLDGRTANARFLKTNLQRNWSYTFSENYDQHFFELLERPLGLYNSRQIDFCLGEGYHSRLNSQIR